MFADVLYLSKTNGNSNIFKNNIKEKDHRLKCKLCIFQVKTLSTNLLNMFECYISSTTGASFRDASPISWGPIVLLL